LLIYILSGATRIGGNERLPDGRWTAVSQRRNYQPGTGMDCLGAGGVLAGLFNKKEDY